MVSHYKMRPGLVEPSIAEESDDFDMFEDDGREPMTADGSRGRSNNLTFYPYANHKLTRSAGTLNLSLSSNELEHPPRLKGIKEVDYNSVDECIDRWSPFKDTNPTTPKSARSKRTSKSDLSPFITDPELTKKWKRESFTSNLTKSWTSGQEMRGSESLAPEVPILPGATAFLPPTGLVSKVAQAQSNFPKKLSIPDTPVKKSPLIESRKMSNSTNDSPSFSNRSYNLTQETSYLQSPPFKSIPQLLIDASPLSASFNILEDNDSERETIVRQQKSTVHLHASKYKKLKKARSSVIVNNNELKNSLQQFTDDLYGTDTHEPTSSRKAKLTDDVSFFNILPPPNGSKPYYDNEGSSSADTTPTRKKSLLNEKTRGKGETFTKSKDSKALDSSPVPTRRFINAKIETNPDSHLFEKFTNVSSVGNGQFSTVYQVTFQQTNKKYAVKAIQPNKHISVKRVLQEIKILSEISESTLDDEGKEYVLNFISSWKHQTSFYIMTEFCENGTLDGFLQEQIVAKKTRLEDWRIWKIIVELSLALRFIHDSCHIVHLDLKPANIMITFEGNLKLGDFGMATHLPLEDLSFENEGDREYIAPEIISDCLYDFKADIFSLGLVIVEIAANVVLPDNGNAWHKLRSGDLSDAGKLSANDIHSDSLFSGDFKVDTNLTDISDYHEQDSLNLLKETSPIPPWVPKFLIDGESLERLVKRMIEPDFKKRPSANEILHAEECIYVEMTRKAGAIIQEDDFGPKPAFFTP